MQSGFFNEEEMGVAQEYKVLARKYRPQNFDDLIGQDVLVKTLTNAIKSERIAHAFILTGIRGVGKTTTARIIAKAMNCVGHGENKPTASPCGKCEHCVAVAEGRHQDVLEMDAASHTGVNDIREIIENVRYKPISARYKIYIIDEVHMLSNSAFNALLKTLEEPPAHVKFIFATTEIRKIPITILSRCQRFDLKRVDVSELSEHFNNIVKKEGFSAEENAIKLIANVSSGSVRDGLSILDQAMALSKGVVTEELTRQMLGLGDTEELFKLYEYLTSGDAQDALKQAKVLYDKGADPVLILQDLLNINYVVSRIKFSETKIAELAEVEYRKAKDLSSNLGVSQLARTWQMMLKGIDEVKNSHLPFAALEMLIIRLCYVSDLPTPAEIVREISKGEAVAKRSAVNENEAQATEQAAQKKTLKFTEIKTFDDVLKMLSEVDEMMLYYHLKDSIIFGSIEGNVISIKLLENCPKNVGTHLAEVLAKQTGQKWQVIHTEVEEGAKTYHQVEKVRQDDEKEKIKNHPSVQAMLEEIEGLKIKDIIVKQVI